ncbi:uncharacterized protein DC041_0012419 [Schistosoma bovis]|uniref:N-acetyltransferase domain-containing protein n=1 Tax=Schistosoma bovis TaxID=6184 RepID=A0A430Q9A0_SCHBO|nr:uncharacterized protein DC041_0012419 [Schistosoma bovis]
MEFGSGLDKVLKQEVAVIYGNKVRELHALEHNQLNVTEADSFKSLASLLDLLGERSAKYENINPSCLAIDFPSKKMLQFLHKHYQLKNPIFSSNNFVVYSKFFDQIFYDTLNIEKHSTIPCELSSIIQIWDTEAMDEQAKLNDQTHIHNKTLNNQQVNELHRTINDQIPIPMIDMKLCNNSNNNNNSNTLTSVYDVSKIDDGNVKLKQGS